MLRVVISSRISSKYLEVVSFFTSLPPTKEVWGKVMFLYLSVIHSCRRGVSAPLHAGIHPQADTLLGRHPSPQILWDTVNKQQVGGMHPTGMHTCLSLPICITIDGFKSNGLFTPHGTRTTIGTGKWWVSILCYVLYILHETGTGTGNHCFLLYLPHNPIPCPGPGPGPVQCV